MMARRQLVIERPSDHAMKGPTCVQISVDDQATIGPWVMTLAVRFGYPLVDRFGAPLSYRLRSVSGEMLLTTGRFADVRFPSGCHFVLEPDVQSTMPMQEDLHEVAWQGYAPLISRRTLLRAGILPTFSLLGLGSGMTTAFAQHLLNPRTSARVPVSLHMTFLHHQQTVRTVTWAPDGSMLASGGDDAVACVWNVGGALVRRLSFPAPVHALAWSPDGEQLVAGVSTALFFFEAQTGVLLAENATQHTAPITSLGWTDVQGMAPLALSAGIDERAIVWNGQTHQPQVIFRQHTSAIEALAVLETTVVTASEGGLARVWDALSGEEIHGYYAETSPLWAVAFSSRGSIAVGGNDGIIHMWSNGRVCQSQGQDVFGWHCLEKGGSFQGQSSAVRAIAFSPDGMKLATAGADKKLIVWSLHTMTPLVVQAQPEVPLALSWSPSGQWLAAALGRGVALWRMHG